MLCSKNAASELSHESRLYKTIVKTANHPMLILNKDKCIINVFNIDNQNKTLPVSEILGKYLDDYKNDPLSPFYQACILFDEVFDKVLETGDAVKLSYKVKNSFLRAQVSRIEDNHVLIHIHDITDIVKESQLVEQNSYKELSMALTAGGLTSWRYDVKERILSSSHNNPVIGDRSTIENVLDRTPLEYKNDIVKMFDDIVSHQSVHRNIRVKIQTVAGDLQWTDIHAMPYLLAPNGDVLIIMGSQKNVTSEYETQQIIDQLNKQSELILDNIHSGLVYIAPDYIVIWENVSKVFHHPSLVDYYKKGTHCYEAFNRNTPCDHCVMCEAMRTLKPAFYEFTNEAGVCVEAMANPLLDVNDKVEGVILRLDDVTQKKDTSKRLKETQRKVSVANKMLSAIVDNLPSSLFVKDVNDHYKYIMVNKEFCNVLGLSENDILGKTDYDLFSKEEADNYRIDDIKTVELNQTKIIDGESISLKNRVAIWYTIKTPIINAGGDNNKLLIVIGIDITENRKAYEELAVAKKKAEESDRLKSSFLANMSHEIRTPLNAIVGFSELMLSSNNDEEKAEYMRIISTNNDLLLRLINDILDLSKLESGVVKLQIMRFDLAEYFKELSATMKQMVLNPDVEFIAVNPYESCIVETDKMRLTQVWHNFMTNAIKYTMTGY
ncbi:MAG: histidine kinase dimerization/phospho-acceptor domain-containing protein, partial [Rikenellaceae bacterium]